MYGVVKKKEKKWAFLVYLLMIYLMFFVSVYLNTCGENPKDHSIKQELVSKMELLAIWCTPLITGMKKK